METNLDDAVNGVGINSNLKDVIDAFFKRIDELQEKLEDEKSHAKYLKDRGYELLAENKKLKKRIKELEAK